MWVSNLSILSVPDVGNSRKATCLLNFISTDLIHVMADVIIHVSLHCRSAYWFRKQSRRQNGVNVFNMG